MPQPVLRSFVGNPMFIRCAAISIFIPFFLSMILLRNAVHPPPTPATADPSAHSETQLAGPYEETDEQEGETTKAAFEPSYKIDDYFREQREAFPALETVERHLLVDQVTMVVRTGAQSGREVTEGGRVGIRAIAIVKGDQTIAVPDGQRHAVVFKLDESETCVCALGFLRPFPTIPFPNFVPATGFVRGRGEDEEISDAILRTIKSGDHLVLMHVYPYGIGKYGPPDEA